MNLDTLFVTAGVLSLITTAVALIKARAIGWLVPFWFLIGWITGEMAVWWLLTQMGFVLLCVLLGVSDGALGWGVALFVASWLGMLRVLVDGFDAGKVFETALRRGLSDDFLQRIPVARRHRLSFQIDSGEWLKPFKFSRLGVRVHKDIAYGDGGKRHLLDVFTPISRGEKRPVLLQIHGGAWMLGHKAEQGQPLLHHMAEKGWVGVSINYRLSPKHAFPAHIIDVKSAIAWIRAHIAEYGGDPDFIAVTGGSAGGHLTTLAALSANYAPWQPGFESVDTTVQAAMPLYACFDFSNRFGIRSANKIDTPISKWVMQVAPEDDPEAWDRGSPVTWVHHAAPPFMVIQGTHDSMIWVEEARRFVAELSDVTQKPVVYAELPGAQHAFEFFHSPRTSHYLNAAAAYLEWTYADWRDTQELDADVAEDPASGDEFDPKVLDAQPDN